MTHTLLSTGRALWSATTQTLAPHAKWMSGVVAALVLGTGGGALALVNLGPDVEQMPIQQVLETVQPLAALPDAELAAQTLTLYRSDITRNTDTADTLLTRLGVFDPLAAQFLRKDALAQQYVFGRSGRSIAVQIQ
ncbi:MAG: M23 family peptidase, partial [Betaproteobacteria bacterium]|nr:M23 family peptidase [Betaproteobacteria bacterium]